MNSFWSLLLMGGAVYGAFTLFVYFSQPSLLYYPEIPSRQIQITPAQQGLSYEDVELTTEDGETLHGWFVPHQQPRATLLFFHGNAGNISHRLDSLRIFNQLGLQVFIFDYRGYGQSSGRPTEKGTYLDAAAAWRYLTEQKQIPSARILLFGRSLGAAIASHVSANNQPLGLILESAFTSVPDIASELYPFLPVRWLSRYQYDIRKILGSLSCPVLVVHSREDEIIPFVNGQRLFEAANDPKQFLELRGGHNDGFILTGKNYLVGLDRFIQQSLASDN